MIIQETKFLKYKNSHKKIILGKIFGISFFYSTFNKISEIEFEKGKYSFIVYNTELNHFATFTNEKTDKKRIRKGFLLYLAAKLLQA